MGLTFTACGDDKDFANEPRPPAPINVDGVITDDGITIDPPSFGAGPVVLRVANLTDAPQKVTVETSGSGSGVRQTTAAINPNGAGTLKIELAQGRYVVSVTNDAIQSARVRVGKERPSSQDELLQP